MSTEYFVVSCFGNYFDAHGVLREGLAAARRFGTVEEAAEWGRWRHRAHPLSASIRRIHLVDRDWYDGGIVAEVPGADDRAARRVLLAELGANDVVAQIQDIAR